MVGVVGRKKEDFFCIGGAKTKGLFFNLAR